MVWDEESLERLEERIRKNYGECRLERFGDTLEVGLGPGCIRCRGGGIQLYLNNELAAKQEAQSEEERYARLENLLILLEDWEKQASPAFRRACEQSDLQSIGALIAIAAALVLAAICIKSTVWLVLLLALLAAGGFLLVRFVQRRSLAKAWHCPDCGAALAIERDGWLAEPQFLAQCPECGASLLDADKLEKQGKAGFGAQGCPNPEPEPMPCRQRRGICALWGLGLLAVAGLGLAWMLGRMGGFSPTELLLESFILLSVGAAGSALLYCKPPTDPAQREVQFSVGEKSAILWMGAPLTMLGLLVLGGAFLRPQVGILPQAGEALAGLLLLLAGVWALLARQNRRLSVLSDSVLEVSALGRLREFEAREIIRLENGPLGLVNAVGRDGRVLFRLHRERPGAKRALCWMEQKGAQFPQLHQRELAILSWNEGERTLLHSHLTAVRVGLAISLMMLLAGCFGPIWMFRHTDMEWSTELYWAAFAPLPLLVLLVAAAPVLIWENRPQKASREWKRLHIKLPVIFLLLLALGYGTGMRRFWAEGILQVVDGGRLLAFAAVLAVLVLAMIWRRTPRRKCRKDGFVPAALCLLLLCWGTAYGISFAAGQPQPHIPAVVTAKSEPQPESGPYTLTVKLSDGTPAKLRVSRQLYELQEQGQKLVVCEQKDPLGIRMVRLHPQPDAKSGPNMRKEFGK